MLERDLSFLDAAPIRIDASTVIDAPREAVWAVVVDHRGWTTWFGSSLRRCQPTSVPEEGVGSTRVVGLRGGAEVHERFIAWDEPALWAFTGTAMKPAAFTSLVERILIDPLGSDHCRVTYTMALAPAPWMRPMAPLLRAGVGRTLRSALQGLDRQVRRGRTPPEVGRPGRSRQ